MFRRAPSNINAILKLDVNRVLLLPKAVIEQQTRTYKAENIRANRVPSRRRKTHTTLRHERIMITHKQNEPYVVSIDLLEIQTTIEEMSDGDAVKLTKECYQSNEFHRRETIHVTRVLRNRSADLYDCHRSSNSFLILLTILFFLFGVVHYG